MEFDPSTSAETYHPSMMRQASSSNGVGDSVRSQGTMTHQQHDCACALPDFAQQETYRGYGHAGGVGAAAGIPSPQSSPRSAALPSPPDSPTPSMTDSLSSYPSVGSSFFFSSGAASPHHTHTSSYRGGAGGGHRRRAHYSVSDADSGVESGVDPMHALIIPSLTLPAPVPQPTAHGQTLGEVSLLLIGNAERGEAGTKALAEFLADADDVVDVCDWEDMEDENEEDEGRAAELLDASGGKKIPRRRKARVLHASSDWLEEHDLHGLERYEGTKNLAFVELEGIHESESTEDVIESISQHVLDVFRDTSSHLAGSPGSSLLHALLASGNSTLYTALVYITSSPQSSRDRTIISSLAKLLPVIPLSGSSVAYIQAYRDRDLSPHRDRYLRASQYEQAFPVTSQSTRSHSHSREHERDRSRTVTELETASSSPFMPHTPSALRAGLFRTPHALVSLRTEAASRFFRWREVERVLEGDSSILSFDQKHLVGATTKKGKGIPWSKHEWEMELSADYASKLNSVRRRSVASLSPPSFAQDVVAPGITPLLDPLHLSSFMLLSLSLFTPSKRKIFPEAYGRKFDLKKPSSPTRSATELKVDAREESRSAHSSCESGSTKRRWTTAVKWGFVLVGAFCAGVGIGLVLSSSV